MPSDESSGDFFASMPNLGIGTCYAYGRKNKENINYEYETI